MLTFLFRFTFGRGRWLRNCRASKNVATNFRARYTNGVPDGRSSRPIQFSPVSPFTTLSLHRRCGGIGFLGQIARSSLSGFCFFARSWIPKSDKFALAREPCWPGPYSRTVHCGTLGPPQIVFRPYGGQFCALAAVTLVPRAVLLF